MSASATSLTITLKSLSGDLLTLDVPLNYQIHHLPTLFINQFKYNPAIVKRFRFFSTDENDTYTDETDKKEEQKEYQKTDFVEKHGQKTWADIVPEGTDHYFLCFFITEDNESDTVRNDKMKLVRKIILDKRMYTNMSDEELYSLYSEWNLHYLPPPKTNRYLNLSAFVEHNRFAFMEWTEEEWSAMQKKKEEEAKQRQESVTSQATRFLQGIRPSSIQSLGSDTRREIIAQERLAHLLESRPVVVEERNQFRQEIEAQDNSRHYALTIPRQRRIQLRRIFTRLELVQMGFADDALCKCLACGL